MKRRVLSIFLTLALCLNLCPVWALATDAGADSGLCLHHLAHTAECGYAAPEECTHTHSEDCYTTKNVCVHTHTDECYSESGELDRCTHQCTEDSGCIVRTLDCQHKHDNTCGSAGAPCTFVCRICPIEDLIGQLPDSVSADNSEQVQTQLGEIYALYDELTEDEQDQVDLSPCVSLMNQMDGMGDALLGDTPVGNTFTLGKSETESLTNPRVIDKLWTYTINGTLSAESTSAIQITSAGELNLMGGGTVISSKSTAVEVQSGGSLSVTGAGLEIKGKAYALDIASGATVKLSAGTYSSTSNDNTAAIHTANGEYADLLADGYAFFGADGNPISPADVANAKTVTVGKCTNHEQGDKYTHTAGTTTHTWTCQYCGTGVSENCTFTFPSKDSDNIGTCSYCKNALSIVIDERDLSDLVYDGTMKPENVKITVKLNDDSNKELVKDTDYTVVYEPRKDVGNITVTVTGLTFEGTFAKTYEVTRDTPDLSWADSNPVAVNYDGAPVEASDLPEVSINIQSTIDNLEGYLQYSHGKQGDTDYTPGLPKDAGTYDVIVSLPELPNFKGAVSDPITLTINPIAPIVTAPIAKTLTFNRLPQALVTAGTLAPVAVADGLKIQFATSETGTYDSTIPTGTNAGKYTVWYKVVGLTDNYITPNPNPAEIADVEIQRKQLTPDVTLSDYTYLYDGGYKQPAVTVKDDVTILPNTEYEVEYVNNRNVSTEGNPAKVVVTDKAGGNYDLEKVEVEFKITSKTQDALSIINQPNTFTYGDKFTLGTSGGSGSGLVTWEITAGKDTVATVSSSGQVTITGHGSVTVKATKSGKDPDTGVVNYEDATATWTFTADQKPVTAMVTAEDKTYDGKTDATVNAVVEEGVLSGDVITITGLTGTFSDENAGADKTVTVVTTGATISGQNSEHYAVSYSGTTVKATIEKAVAKITTAPGPANPTYNGSAQALISTTAVTNPTGLPVEYALSEDGPYSTAYPQETNAGSYTVWYRVQETPNYIGLAPASIDVTIAKKPVSPQITLDQDTFVYDGTAKKPVVTLKEADGTTVISAEEYTVAYNNNVNVSTADAPATVTATAKDDGNYTFENAPVTATFTINKEQAQVITAPEPAGDPLTFNTRAQKLVTAGEASGGTMVYRVGDTGDFKATIPTETDAGVYTVHYKVQGDSNHSDSDVGQVSVTIAPKTVDKPTIELQNADGSPLVNYTYDGNAKTPTVVVKDGSTEIANTEYNIVYSDNINAGHGTVNITDKPGGNYTVTGSATFVINKADIVFNPFPKGADITYDGKAHELLVPGTTTGGTVQYALNSATSTYTDAIPTAIEAGNYTVYYKVLGDKNHNDLNDIANQKVDVTIQRKPLTAPTIELTPNAFVYDGAVHLPTVTVKDGDTVLPGSEYAWACDNDAPTQGGTYTITISDATGGNYDLSGVVAPNNAKTFTIGKAAQETLEIAGKPTATNYGDSFQLTTGGGSGDGVVTWSVKKGPATVNGGNVTITGVGEVTINVVKDGDTNYEQTSAEWTFTAAPKPVTAAVTVNNKYFDNTTAATVASADISVDILTGDTVTIDPSSITAVFDDPHAGTGKTVALDASKVQVTGDDAAKYAISYPATVTADIIQADTTITADPEAIAPLTYSGQPQALVTAGQTNVGFLVYSLDGTTFSSEIPTGTNAGTYTVYYKVDETTDYTGVAVNAPPVSVTIDPKTITPKVSPETSSYLYDGTKKEPVIVVKDGETVISEDQYTVTWANDDTTATGELLTAAGTYTATVTPKAGGNYTFTNTATAQITITEADQTALKIIGKPEHVYYGDTFTLDTTGGSANGTVTWRITAGGTNSNINSTTGALTVKDTGSITVEARRTVPNYADATDTWTFTVEPKPVVAEVTITPKTYDGNTSIADGAITASVKANDLVNGDAVTLGGLKGAYDDANAGTGKTVTLNDTGATKTDGNGKYTVSYPATAKGDITPKAVTVTVTLSDHDLKLDTNGQYYEYDGTEKTPTVTVTANDGAVLAASDYSVSYANNKNVSTDSAKATVTVTAKEGGNYTFDTKTTNFEIRSTSAVLTSSPQAKDLTYTGQAQELVTVGTATGGTVVYSESLTGPFKEEIPKQTAAGTYTVYYKVQADTNHTDTDPGQVSVTIKSKEITPAITLNPTSYEYDGTAKTPAVTVKDGKGDTETTIDAGEYSVSYRDNVNAGTATVTVSDANGGNYIVNGTATFEITKAAPTVTAPTGKTGLQYNGEPQALVNAGVCSEGTVMYSVNGGNYSADVPTASAVGTYKIDWKVVGDTNHRDTAAVALDDVVIAKNTVNNPTITLSSDTFKYNGSQQKPIITVYDNKGRVIPEHEYTVTITGTNGNDGMVDVDTYTIKITTPITSNYVIRDDSTVNVRTFKIVPADQETISIIGTKAQVCYGDTIQLGTSGGTGGGTTSWEVKANDGSTIGSTISSTISGTGLLTVKDVGGPMTVTVTRSGGGNYTDVSATWEFTAAKKPVTAVLTGVDKPFDGNTDATVKAKVDASNLVSGDAINIDDLAGAFEDPNVGTDKKVTVNSSNPTVTGTNSEKYDIAYPATTTASISAVAATVDTDPAKIDNLVYDASQAQALVTAGTATGGTMVYSLDGNNFSPAIPEAKDAGTYTVYYKAQGDGNHTNSEMGTVNVTIGQQTVTPQIELSPPSGQYDGRVQQPKVTVRDGANNVIPESEYKVTYVSDNGENWKDKGPYTVRVENITGGNYVVNTATATFEISTTAQAPLEIVNKPGLVYYGDTFTLSATGGSSSVAVTWSSSNENIAHIDANGFVTIKGTGPATITATKAGGGNYDTATATYPLNALKKPITAIVTADDKVYDGDTDATIHVTWKDGDLINGDIIHFSPAPFGTFADKAVGTNIQVTVTAKVVDDTISQKYAITIPPTTTASITKAVATAPTLTAKNRVYDGTDQALVTGGNTGTTVYSNSMGGVYSFNVPTGTDAGTYTVWYKEKGDANHNDSEPQSIQVTISPKPLTLGDAGVTVELSGNNLLIDNGVYYYKYDGTEKKPTVTIKYSADGKDVVVPANEYTVSYSDNQNVSTADKKATVTITDNANGNYTVSGNITFEIRAGAAELTGTPQAKNLTYTGQAQELVTVGTATGGHIEYRLHSKTDPQPSFSKNIPTATSAGTYTVDYKVVGDDNHEGGPTGSVTVTIQPKTVVSPKITVDVSYDYTYSGSAKTPTVTVEDGTATILASEYTLSYQNNVNAGTATVIVTDNNGGNYTVNGTATFEIDKVAAAVGTAPTGKTGLKYNATEQELITAGSSNDGTMVYSLSETGEYSAAIPTGKAVGEYEIWYKVLGDDNHSDSTATALSPKVKIEKNTVTEPTIQVTPATVKYTGEKQEPTVTVKDDAGLVIDGSEYTVTYADTANSNNNDLTQVGTYTLTITEVTDGNYTFDTTDGKNTAKFTITTADQDALTISGTRERVYYGDTIQLGTTGGISGGTVTWKVSDGEPANIDANGLLTITGTGSVTVTATSAKTGYADQTATWALYADKKPVTALVTAASKTYDGNATATVTATLQAIDFVGTDSFTITLTGCTFENANAGTDKKVNVVSTSPSFTPSADVGSTDNHENYAITYPATVTASISKADIADTDVIAPTAAENLMYTGLPQALIDTAGSAPGGTMEYSTDNINYSASLPTGTDAGDYDVWYRVKGDGNHNDTAGTKLTNPVTIAKQTVATPTIEFNPSGASYDGQEHKPSVTVKDANGRVIPAAEYTMDYGSTNWKDVGDHTVTITGKADGNYSITGTPTAKFTILPAGQNPLSITGQPGEVKYGDAFTLSTNGGSGTGAVTWESSDSAVAYVNSQTGRVEIRKAGGPVTITARKAAGGGFAETTATWTFSAEKRPATAIVTARNKPYDSNTTATLDVSWKDGDLLNGDTITLSLTGAFDDANVGTDKIVRITRNGDLPDGGGKYAVTYNTTTTASITAQAATVSGSTPTTLTYDGNAQSLVTGVTAQNGTVIYSRDGVDFTENAPAETNAGEYRVWYKARGNTNYADSEARIVDVTIQPRTVSSPTIELSSDSFEYDGTAKEPGVVVKDSSNVIPASEYTVSYRNNTAVGTATVTITDNAGGNYTVNGSATFTIKAGAPVLKAEPQPRNLTYNGREQTLVTRGTAENGHMEYSLDEYDDYSTAIPKGTDAHTYDVWYKVVSDDGKTETLPESVTAEILQKPFTPTVTVNLTSDPLPYTGNAQKPGVTVVAEGNTLTQGTDYVVAYSNNRNPGTATVTVTSIGGNYQFSTQATFEIAKSKATFAVEPEGLTDLVYTGEEQELIEENTGISLEGTVLYSLNAVTYSAEIPTGVKARSYTIFAKIQGDSKHEDSDPITVSAKINTNEVKNPHVTLSSNSVNYTGNEQKPTVTVMDDNGNVIPATEYTVTYSNNINVGTATVTITSKGSNCSFTTTAQFQIVGADQPILSITGKPDRVYYGDTITTLRTEGGSGAVTWSMTGGTNSTIDQTTGRLVVKDAGTITVTASTGTLSDSWTFNVEPKPVTAIVTAANKPYDGNITATLTVALSGLLSGDNIATNTEDGVKASGHFADASVGENKPVVIDSLTIPTAVSAKYDIGYNSTTTASITPAAATVTKAPTLAGSLTYNGGAQPLLIDGGTAANGNLMYSLDGKDYSYTIPTGTDAKTYTVWYKVEASDDNHKDSAAVKLGDVTISVNGDNPTVLCMPSTFQYNGTEQTPTVVVRDSANRIIPESEYTVELPTPRIAVKEYTVTVKDKPGGNYKFDTPVTGTFEIVAASQNPLNIVTDIPTDVHYGDTFRLSAMGGSGSGAIHWSIEESSVATINANGVVTVIGTGGFTVKAFRAASDGYDKSNTDSVPFVANPKPVTPVVTASDKSYDGKTDVTLTASWKSGDLVSGDTITITATGVFATADAGTNKRVNVTTHEVTADAATLAKYTITWPDSTTAAIYKVDAKLATAPAGADLTYDGSAKALVTGGTTVNGIGKVEYSTSQNGAYSETIPTGTNAGTYTVWYKVADSVNYTGIAPAAIEVEIKKATPTITTPPTANSGTEGQTLSSITFSNGGSASERGTFAWKDGTITPSVGQSQQTVIFTPTDAANYNPVEVQIEVTIINRSSNDSTQNRAPMKTTVQNGTANTVLSTSGGTKLVNDAIANQSDSIVIKPEITEEVTKAQVSIPTSTVSQIKNQTNAALTVSAPIADVTIPNAALDTLSSAGGTVNVVTEQVDQGVALTLTAGGETVNSVPGGVTLTVPAEDATPGTVAVLVGEDGSRQVIQKSVAKDGAVSVPLDGSATVELVDNSKTFEDVSDQDWASDAVAFTSAREMFNGTSETTFSPDETMSRGMLTTVLYNLEGAPAQEMSGEFSDVSSDAWYADSVTWAVENGIVDGYGDSQFGPDDAVTREQFAVMLWKYAGSPAASDEALAAFTDADQVSGYAQEALCWAVENGIVSGYNGQLTPGETATRAQAAQMLKNFMENT